MSVTNDPFDSSDLVAFIKEVWTPIVNNALFAKTVLANWVIDLSPFMDSGGDIAHVPNLYTNQLSLRTQSTQGAEISTDSPTQIDTTLAVNVHQYVAWIMGDKDLQQLASIYDVGKEYGMQAAGILADALEDALAGLWSSISTNTIGDTGTVLTDAEIRQAIEKLDSTNYNMDEVAFFVHPYTYWIQLHAITKYYDQSSIGDGKSVVRSGNFGSAAAERALRGQLFGIPVFVTSNIVSGLQTHRNLLLHKSAFGFAVQTKGGGKVRIQSESQLRNLGTLVVADIIYGVKILRDEGAVLINSSNTFIGS